MHDAPGTDLITAFIAARSSSGFRFMSTRTISSDAETGSACWSRSARPVFRVTERTPSISRSFFTTFSLTRSDSASDVPGTSDTNTVYVSSWNGGRKLDPNRAPYHTDTPTSAAARRTTSFGSRTARARNGV